MRRRDAPRLPRYLHCLGDRAEGCTGAVHGRYMVEECTMNVNGRVLGKWKCPGCICMSSIRTLNRMMASSALLQNGRLDRAGTARKSGPVGFGSAQQPRRTIEARRLSGGRLHIEEQGKECRPVTRRAPCREGVRSTS